MANNPQDRLQEVREEITKTDKRLTVLFNERRKYPRPKTDSYSKNSLVSYLAHRIRKELYSSNGTYQTPKNPVGVIDAKIIGLLIYRTHYLSEEVARIKIAEGLETTNPRVEQTKLAEREAQVREEGLEALTQPGIREIFKLIFRASKITQERLRRQLGED
ncbi:MAG: chorismate mutase [Nanoarchaeota archaeon]|nr:chorismate mutase [Nanoarchaeota archaeon]